MGLTRTIRHTIVILCDNPGCKRIHSVRKCQDITQATEAALAAGFATLLSTGQWFCPKCALNQVVD